MAVLFANRRCTIFMRPEIQTSADLPYRGAATELKRLKQISKPPVHHRFLAGP